MQALTEMGADHVINYLETDWVKEIWKLYSKPHRRKYEGGVTVVVNFTGGDTWVQGMRCLRRGGRLLTCGALAHPKGEAAVSWDTLEEYAPGLHCLSGGREGPVAHALRNEGLESSRRLLERLAHLFPARFSIELQRHATRHEEERNRALHDPAGPLRLPPLPTHRLRRPGPPPTPWFFFLDLARPPPFAPLSPSQTPLQGTGTAGYPQRPSPAGNCSRKCVIFTSRRASWPCYASAATTRESSM